METDLELDPGRVRRADGSKRRLEIERDRLLAEDVLSGRRSGLDHRYVERRRRGDRDRIDARIAK